MNEELLNKSLQTIEHWQKDVWAFCEEALGMNQAEPIDSLRGKVIEYSDSFGRKHSTLLFDNEGRLTYHDLTFYTIDMFKNQDRDSFKKYNGKYFTWQQTLEIEAYQRALNTFDKDSYDEAKRRISIRSGHGIGKTSFLSVISLHFLICFFGSQIGVTANTEDQLKDIFLKELSMWCLKLREELRSNVEIMDDMVRIKDQRDWFLRARVARPEKPEALAGLHAQYVLLIVDEASAVHSNIFEVSKGALTGENWVVVYASNPTRTEGEFYESQKAGSNFTKLHFSCRQSPIVKENYIRSMEEDYGKDSDEVKIRVDGTFAGVSEMDDKGWIPLFANVRILFEPERYQIINRGIIGVDPSGQGKDRTVAMIRDSIYLKEVLNEATSNEKDLARKIETIRDAYNCVSNDIGIDGFGIGAKVIAEIQTKMGESVNAVLTDKPREETKDKYHNFKAELAWKFREWCLKGGIIITNKQKEWIREFEKIKYKRDGQGRIMLMGKVEFKKEYGFSPDRFDGAIYTFFRDDPTQKAVMKKEELELADLQKWRARVDAPTASENLSSM